VLNFVKKWPLISFIVVLAGCTPEQNYRGVPSPQWQQLTPEQKQLIVDQSFKDEMKKIELDS
jgi:hypothetical protein